MDVFQKLYYLGINKYNDKIILDEELAGNAAIHRLIPSVLANTKCVSDDINGFTFSSYVKYREQQHKEIEKVIDLLNEKRINYLFLKGIVLENYYPETTSRQYQDYDLIIESINEFANIHTELEDLGFEHDYIPVLAEVNGKVVGLIKLSKKINEGNYIKLEINIGGFPITDVTTLPSSEIWEDSMTIVWRNKEIKVPSTDISMFILLIEMTGNKQKRIRDLVDFYHLKKCADMDKVKVKAKKWRVSKQLQLLSKMVNEVENGNFKNTKSGKKNDFYFRYKLEKVTIPILIKNIQFKTLVYHYINLSGHKILNYLNNYPILGFFKRIKSYERYQSGILTSFIPLEEVNIKSNSMDFIKINGAVISINPLGTFLLSSYCIETEEDLISLESYLKCGGFEYEKYNIR